jgi:hypothetical protein
MVINMTKYGNGIHVCETAAKEVEKETAGWSWSRLLGWPGNHLSP